MLQPSVSSEASAGQRLDSFRSAHFQAPRALGKVGAAGNLHEGKLTGGDISSANNSRAGEVNQSPLTLICKRSVLQAMYLVLSPRFGLGHSGVSPELFCGHSHCCLILKIFQCSLHPISLSLSDSRSLLSPYSTSQTPANGTSITASVPIDQTERQSRL